MFVYQKKLQYPVKIRNCDPKLAALIISQYGGPDGELGASLRYLSQRYAMPYPELKGLLTDIGTEELGHLEMIGAIVHQLTRKLSDEQVREGGFDAYFVDHTTGVYPTAASGWPFNAASMAVKGDVICDLTEDMAAEQKARVTYDNILRLSDDPDVNDVIRFLREREIVHFQRFGEAKRTGWKKTAGKAPGRLPCGFALMMPVLGADGPPRPQRGRSGRCRPPRPGPAARRRRCKPFWWRSRGADTGGREKSRTGPAPAAPRPAKGA